MKEVVVRIAIEEVVEAAPQQPPTTSLPELGRDAASAEVEADGPALTFKIPTTLAEIEREAITRTLDYTGGDKTLAAQTLGIDPATIYRKLKKYKEQDVN